MDLVLPKSLYKVGWILQPRKIIIYISLVFLAVFKIEKLFRSAYAIRRLQCS